MSSATNSQMLSLEEFLSFVRDVRNRVDSGKPGDPLRAYLSGKSFEANLRLISEQVPLPRGVAGNKAAACGFLLGHRAGICSLLSFYLEHEGPIPDEDRARFGAKLGAAASILFHVVRDQGYEPDAIHRGLAARLKTTAVEPMDRGNVAEALGLTHSVFADTIAHLGHEYPPHVTARYCLESIGAIADIGESLGLWPIESRPLPAANHAGASR